MDTHSLFNMNPMEWGTNPPDLTKIDFSRIFGKPFVRNFIVFVNVCTQYHRLPLPLFLGFLRHKVDVGFSSFALLN
jgi:hypothetical protein